MADEPQGFGATLAIVYFGIGFALAATLTAALGFFLVDPKTASMEVRVVTMLAPAAAGLFFGARTSIAGGRDGLLLGEALKRAFLFRGRR